MKKRIALLAALLTGTLGFAQKDVSGSYKTEITVVKEMTYLLHVPEMANKGKKPLIVFMHGSGERGTNTELLKIHGPFKYLKTHTLDAYVLAVQCPGNQLYDAEAVYQLIQKTVKDNNIDNKRIYLTGLSMGGWGVWEVAQAHPEAFAALVPVAGYADSVPMIEDCKALGSIPTRIYHGLLDNDVEVAYAVAIYKQLKPCAKDMKLVIFDDANHDSWTRVYDNPETYEWMLKQSRP